MEKVKMILRGLYSVVCFILMIPLIAFAVVCWIFSATYYKLKDGDSYKEMYNGTMDFIKRPFLALFNWVKTGEYDYEF